MKKQWMLLTVLFSSALAHAEIAVTDPLYMLGAGSTVTFKKNVQIKATTQAVYLREPVVIAGKNGTHYCTLEMKNRSAKERVITAGTQFVLSWTRTDHYGWYSVYLHPTSDDVSWIQCSSKMVDSDSDFPTLGDFLNLLDEVVELKQASPEEIGGSCPKSKS